MNFRGSKLRRDFRLDITPLIDCVFLLLIFFLISSSFVRDRAAIKLNLPRAGKSAATTAPSAVTLQVAKDGQYYIDSDQPLTEEQVEDYLRHLAQEMETVPAAAGTPSKVVKLKADREAQWEKVVRLFELLQKYKFTSTDIETRIRK